MEIYINSRGKKQNQDYHWRHISRQGERPASEPDIIREYSKCIDREDFSLVLASSKQKLFLLITGLEPENSRIDIKRRIISNSLALIANWSDEERFRLIAASALQGELAQKLEDTIEFDSEEGFQVKFTYKELLEKITPTFKAGGSPPKKAENTIQFLSDENKIKLSEELENYRFPRKEGLLVIVARSTPESVLRKKEVWRGLTCNIETSQLATSNNRRENSSIREAIFRIINSQRIVTSLIFLLLGLLLWGGVKSFFFLIM